MTTDKPRARQSADTLEEEPPASLIERVLAYASFSIIVVAVFSFIVTLVVGLIDRTALAAGMWPFVVGVSYVGLPIGFVLLIVLLFMSYRRRGREQRGLARRPQGE